MRIRDRNLSSNIDAYLKTTSGLFSSWVLFLPVPFAASVLAILTLTTVSHFDVEIIGNRAAASTTMLLLLIKFKIKS